MMTGTEAYNNNYKCILEKIVKKIPLLRGQSKKADLTPYVSDISR